MQSMTSTYLLPGEQTAQEAVKGGSFDEATPAEAEERGEERRGAGSGESSSALSQWQEKRANVVVVEAVVGWGATTSHPTDDPCPLTPPPSQAHAGAAQPLPLAHIPSLFLLPPSLFPPVQ
jgi:hypothetical protein